MGLKGILFYFVEGKIYQYYLIGGFITKNKGFTLPEVLISLSILTIICSFALISGQNSINSTNLINSTNQLSTDIRNLQFISLENNSTQTTQLKLYSTYYQLLSNDTITKTISLPKNISLKTNAGSLPAILEFDTRNLNNNSAAIITLKDSNTSDTRSIILTKTTNRIRISKNPSYLSDEN